MTDGETNPSAEPATEEPNPADAKMAKLVYICFIIGFFFGPLVIVGLVIAYVQTRTGPAWLESHYRFQIRTFWIAILYFIFVFLLGFIAIILGSLFEILNLFAIIPMALAIFIVVFWFVRCIKGFGRASHAKRIVNPVSWKFGTR
jgi:uncharacterized membrane protein